MGVTLAVALLSACGAPREVPSVVVADAAARMASLKSLRYDLTGTMKVHSVIPGLTGSGSAFAAILPTDLSTKFDGSAASVLPDRTSIDMHQTAGDTTTRVRAIMIGDTYYFTNPTTGAWLKTSLQGTGLPMTGSSSLNQFDPSNTNQFLKDARSLTDLGDGQLDGVRVHHYRLFLDPEKLKAVLQSSGKTSLLSGITSGLMIKSYRIEEWVGIDDHLLRQTQMDYAMSLVAPSPTARPAGCVPVKLLQTPPPGAIACPPDLSGAAYDTSASMRMKFHDFNVKLTIDAPPNAQDVGSFGNMFGSNSSSSAGVLGVPTPKATR